MKVNKIKSEFEKNGIRTRVLVLFVNLVILPYIILIVAVFSVFQQHTSKTYGKSMADTVTAISTHVSSNLKKYEEATMSFYYNGSVELLDQSGSSTKQKFINAALSSYCYSYSGVVAVYIDTPDKEYYSGTTSFRDFSEAMSQYKKEIVNAGGECKWYASNERFGKGYGSYFILTRSLNSTKTKNVGTLYVVVSKKMITDAFDQLRMQDAVKYLIDGQGNIMYCTDKSQKGQFDIAKVVSGEKSGYSMTGSEVIAFYHCWDTDWYFISTISVKKMMESIMQLKILIIVVSMIYLLFLYVMIQLIQKYIFKPVSTLKHSMDKFAQGDLSVQMNDTAVGELRDLSRHFNRMTTKIQSLVEKNKEEEIQKNNFKMQVLVAQLKPHFVYNALNTIKWTAVVNKQENIQKLTQSLIHVLMNASKVDDKLYTVSEEIDLIKNYAVIQKARFMNFDLLIDVQDDAMSCSLRKFVIQPIVENAIVHGIGRDSACGGIVKLTVWTDSNILKIKVEDNGVGFNVDEWRNNDRTVEDHTNIGIKSIEQIIALEYGKEYGLNIISEKGKGTSVEYFLPIVKREA